MSEYIVTKASDTGVSSSVSLGNLENTQNLTHSLKSERSGEVRIVADIPAAQMGLSIMFGDLPAEDMYIGSDGKVRKDIFFTGNNYQASTIGVELKGNTFFLVNDERTLAVNGMEKQVNPGTVLKSNLHVS